MAEIAGLIEIKWAELNSVDGWVGLAELDELTTQENEPP